MSNIPSAQDIQTTVGLSDQPILRNRKVTQGYHDLSIAGAEFTGGQNLNWCGFACWSSKMIGKFLESEIIISKLCEKLGGHPNSYSDWCREIQAKVMKNRPSVVLTEAYLKNPLKCVLDDSTSSLAAGNAMVYSELATVFSNMISVLGNDSEYSESRVHRVIDQLKDGPSQDNGQTLLKNAIGNYYRARFEGEDAKAELVLLANLQVGLHEQTRLQHDIASFIQAPVVDPLIRPADQTGTGIWALGTSLHAWLHNMFIKLVKPGAHAVMRAWEDVVTEHLLVLELPRQTLQLGHDVVPPPNSPIFPKMLETIEHEELAALLRTYRADGTSAEGSAARDWTDLNQRMRYISVLFRSHQFDKSLLEEPFTPQQRHDIAACAGTAAHIDTTINIGDRHHAPIH